MGDNNDDELMDMWMMGIMDEDGGHKPNNTQKGGGCLSCLLLMISVPVLIGIGLVHLI